MNQKFNGSLVVENKLMAVGKFSEEFQQWVIRNWNGNSSSVSSTVLTLTDEDTLLRFRAIIRDSKFSIDKELTATGFSGDESTDDGVTGDWINIIYF